MRFLRHFHKKLIHDTIQVKSYILKARCLTVSSFVITVNITGGGSRMIELSIIEEEQLILKKVLMKKHQAIALDKTDEKFRAFISQTGESHIQKFGPLVTIHHELKLHDDGTLLTDYVLLTQAHDYQDHQEHYITKDRLEFPKCVALKYKGPAELIHYAHAKLDIYTHDHDLQTTGEVITVLINDGREYIEADIFKPVV